MTATFQRRIINLSYRPDALPGFQTQEAQDDYYRALGRMVAFGLLRDPSEDAIQVVNATITEHPLEICATYHPPVSAQPEQYEDGHRKYLGSPGERTDHLISAILEDARKAGTPFVMAAVRHNDGQWGFHS